MLVTCQPFRQYYSLSFWLVSPHNLLRCFSEYSILTSSDSMSWLGASHIYSVYLSIYCEIYIKFCSAIAEILLLTGAQQSNYKKTRLRESLWNNDIANPHSSRNTKYGFLNFFTAGCKLIAGQPTHRLHHPNACIGSSGLSQPSLSPKFSFQVCMITKELCSKCDLGMSSGERDSLYKGKTFLQC